MAGVVPVRLVVAPEVEPAVPALLGPIVLAAAQNPEEVMEAPGERVVAGLAVTEMPLRGGGQSDKHLDLTERNSAGNNVTTLAKYQSGLNCLIEGLPCRRDSSWNMEIFVSTEVSGKVKPDVLPVTHPAQLVGQCWELR